MPARSLPALRRTSFGCREELATEVRCWGLLPTVALKRFDDDLFRIFRGLRPRS